jgi:hypothetical protein
MAKITLEIPDELSEQLARMGNNPEDWLSQKLPALVASTQQPILPTDVYHYILDFIANEPTPQQIADFRPTLEMQERLQTLLSRSSEGKLTPAEQLELDEYERIEHIIILLKSGNLHNLTQQP